MWETPKLRLMQVRRLQGQGLEPTQGAAIIILDWQSLVAFLAHGAFALLKNGSIDRSKFLAHHQRTKSDITIPLFPLWLGREKRQD